jgi:gamma-glutamyltranspeptidase/glutathione hydrolase
MTVADLAAYEVVEREPVCEDYRGYEVCGMGPPSSGALAVGQILGILEHFDLGTDPLGPEAVHLVSQASRLAFADRNRFVGDSDFVTVPAEGMLDEEYLAERAALIGPEDMGEAEPGTPPGEFDPGDPQPAAIENGTSHLSIVDRYGNALSMTTTIESGFGNGVMVEGGGFLLNNELTDFSFEATGEDGMPIANRVQPEKRPRSSMSPTIVLDENGEVALVTGSPGGSRIIGYTAQSIINVVDFGLDPQEAVNVPHFLNRNTSATDLEAPIPGVTWDYDVDALVTALEDRGHQVSVGERTSGLSVIQVLEDALVGGADYRRDGSIGGQ